MRLAVFALALSLAAGTAAARDPFTVTLTVDGQTGSQGFTTIEGAYNALSTQGLQGIVAGYTDVSAADVALDLRGVPAQGSFAAGSPVLRIVVPGAGIDETFAGATRDESRQLFEDWLKGRGNSQVNRLLRFAAASTPIDPVAGNPNALMNQMVASDFNAAVAAAEGGGGGFGLGARFGSFTAAGFRSQTLQLPFDYQWQLTERDTLELQAPIAWNDTSGANSYSGNIGVLWRRRVTDAWTLQPAFRIGGVGSIDLGSGAGAYSLGLTSTYRLRLAEDWRLTIGNNITYLSTIPISVGEFSIDYGIANTVFRNGLVLTHDLGLTVAGQALTGSAFVVDTRFTGDEVYVKSYQEFGVFVSTRGRNLVGLGVSFLTGERGVTGFAFNAGVRF
jgi:hypothetical protein